MLTNLKRYQELSSLQKCDQFLKLADFYHVERCENEDCNCLFKMNLRYLYVQHTGSVARNPKG